MILNKILNLTRPVLWIKLKQGLFIFLLFSLKYTLLHSQQISDTLLIAKTLQQQGEFTEARNILQKYMQVHPVDYHGLRALAYANYWDQQFSEAEKYFKSGLELYPDDLTLMKDHARFLFETAQYSESKEIYETILQKVQSDAEGLIKSAYIAYYAGQFNSAETYLLKLLSYYPDHKESKDLLNSIYSIYGIWLKAEAKYMEDSQPLTFSNLNLSVQKFIHFLLQPGIEVGTFQVFMPENSISWFELSNKSYFRKSATTLNLTGGIIKNQKNADPVFIGSILLDQHLARYWTLGIDFERDLEFSTSQSFLEPIIYHANTIQTKYQKPGNWTAEAAILSKHFMDENLIRTFYFWLLTPPLDLPHSHFKVGYNFNYANSRQNNFESVLSIERISEIYYPGIQIQGYFTPYFTPKDQFIHSLLLDAQWNFTSKVNIHGNCSLGLFSKSKIPYLYLDIEDNEVVFARDFYDHSVVNYDINTSLNVFLNHKTSLHFVYRHLKNFFYSSNQFQIQLSSNFYHEHK